MLLCFSDFKLNVPLWVMSALSTSGQLLEADVCSAAYCAGSMHTAALLELGSFWDDMTSIPDEAGNTKGYRFSYGHSRRTPSACTI